jgi:hypothetical protein
MERNRGEVLGRYRIAPRDIKNFEPFEVIARSDDVNGRSIEVVCAPLTRPDTMIWRTDRKSLEKGSDEVAFYTRVEPGEDEPLSTKVVD